MKRFRVLYLFLFAFVYAGAVPAAEQQLFGPRQYDVKERYGGQNVYRETFQSAEGLYLIKLQNSEEPNERPDLLELTLNDEVLLKENYYPYGLIGCFVKLKKENTFQLSIKDYTPSGFKRPLLPPRFVILSVTPLTMKFYQGVFGADSREDLKEYLGTIRKIRNSESASLSVQTADLRNDSPVRVEGMRKLSVRRDTDALDFITHVFQDGSAAPVLRAEAAIALGTLGDRVSISLLVRGLIDPDEAIRTGSARGLSFYREEETRAPLTNLIERLDPIRRGALIRTMAGAGWKPLGTLMGLAGSPDPFLANAAIELLGRTGDPKAVDLLLNCLEHPGQRDIRAVIRALGESGSIRAVGPLRRMAQDPVRRKGSEAELGMALADLGDRKAVDVITDMVRTADSLTAQVSLRETYRRLTGKDFK